MIPVAGEVWPTSRGYVVVVVVVAQPLAFTSHALDCKPVPLSRRPIASHVLGKDADRNSDGQPKDTKEEGDASVRGGCYCHATTRKKYVWQRRFHENLSSASPAPRNVNPSTFRLGFFVPPRLVRVRRVRLDSLPLFSLPTHPHPVTSSAPRLEAGRGDAVRITT